MTNALERRRAWIGNADAASINFCPARSAEAPARGVAIVDFKRVAVRSERAGSHTARASGPPRASRASGPTGASATARAGSTIADASRTEVAEQLLPTGAAVPLVDASLDIGAADNRGPVAARDPDDPQ
jgi:hypothetical protein